MMISTITWTKGPRTRGRQKKKNPEQPCHKVIDDAQMKQINAGQADSRHSGFGEHKPRNELMVTVCRLRGIFRNVNKKVSEFTKLCSSKTLLKVWLNRNNANLAASYFGSLVELYALVWCMFLYYFLWLESTLIEVKGAHIPPRIIPLCLSQKPRR